MDFFKMQGAGNDFIIINNINLKIPVDKLPAISKRLCSRRLSIGADGFMALDKAEGKADFKMRFYNSDGSLGEMCGNGARCISRYAFVNGLAGKKMCFETGAGLVYSEVLEDHLSDPLGERLVRVLLNNPELIKLDNDIDLEGEKFEASYIELGRPALPHLVVNYDIKNADLDKMRETGKKLRYLKQFSKGTNVNFCQLVGDDSAVIKTYERGVEDFTLACGTGSAATALALSLKGCLKGGKARILADGGELLVEIERTADTIEKLFLTGDTNIVASGKVTDEDLTY